MCKRSAHVTCYGDADNGSCEHNAVDLEKAPLLIPDNFAKQCEGDQPKESRGHSRPFMNGEHVSAVLVLRFKKPSENDGQQCAHCADSEHQIYGETELPVFFF